MAPAETPPSSEGPARRSEVLGRLRAAADASGFVPFDRFMQVALYDPAVGYYARRRSPLGPGGDFYTAAHASPLFAAALARRIRSLRSEVGGSDRFRIVELGPGDGTLGAGLLAALSPAPGGYEYIVIERSPARAEEALRRVGETPGGIPARRLEWLGEDGPFTGVVVANEFLDAQPARRLRWDGAEWLELGAEIGPDEVLPAERALVRAVPGAPLPTVDEAGTVFEFSPAAEGTVREIADHLERGAAILIDYGADESELLRGRPRGTLAAFRGHRAVEDPWADPGTADLSVFVNFTRLRSAARASGLTETAYRSQAEALGAWGFPELLEEAVRSAGSAEAQVRVRLAAKNLLFGFENFRALELGAGAASPT